MDFENNDMEGLDEELDNIIILNDEDGNEVQFEFLDLIELDGEEYVVLLPVEDDEEEDGNGSTLSRRGAEPYSCRTCQRGYPGLRESGVVRLKGATQPGGKRFGT